MTKDKNPNEETINQGRGTGRTTQAIHFLPTDSIYIIGHSDRISRMIYFLDSINRRDIRLVGPDWILESKFRAFQYPGLGLDHDTLNCIDIRDIIPFCQLYKAALARIQISARDHPILRDQKEFNVSFINGLIDEIVRLRLERGY